MNKETEGLKQRIILAINRQFSWDGWEDSGKHIAPKIADEILEACKEAGLKFVPEEWELLPKLNENYEPPKEVGEAKRQFALSYLAILGAINSEIKEIEI